MELIWNVTSSLGEILAKDLDCSFAEVAASEQVTQVAEVFHEVRTNHSLIIWFLTQIITLPWHYLISQIIYSLKFYNSQLDKKKLSVFKNWIEIFGHRSRLSLQSYFDNIIHSWFTKLSRTENSFHTLIWLQIKTTTNIKIDSFNWIQSRLHYRSWIYTNVFM